jgi:hypothetical protein
MADLPFSTPDAWIQASVKLSISIIDDGYNKVWLGPSKWIFNRQSESKLLIFSG